MNRTLLRLLPSLFLAGPMLAQPYKVGDIMDNFTLTDRATGQPAQLHDFAGKVVFLDFFAVWCPFCVAAAPGIDTGIVALYDSRGGNAKGVPVQRVGMNLQADTAFYKPRTDAFVNQYHIQPVLQDTARAVANRFGSGQPIFVVVNGVAGSPSHAQWEIVAIVNNYGSSTAPISTLTAAIDRVAAPVAEPPTPVKLLASDLPGTGTVRLRIEGNRREEIILRRSDNLVTWTDLGVSIPDSEETLLEISIEALEGDRFLQAVRVP